METNKNSIKIISLGMILLIIAGMIVVALKGFGVSLLFGKHEAVELKLGKEINLSTVEEICSEVFENKKYVVKELEVFADSVQINVQAITDEEKANLISKINEKFEVEKTVDDLKVYSVSNKRIRDVVKPYIAPMLISFGIVFVYMFIRFYKIKPVAILAKLIAKVVLTELILLSIIAIIRMPVSDLLINLLMIVPVLELIYCMHKSENERQEIKDKS